MGVGRIRDFIPSKFKNCFSTSCTYLKFGGWEVMLRRLVSLVAFLAVLMPALSLSVAGAATPNAPTAVSLTNTLAGVKVSWTAPSPVSGVTILGFVVTSTPNDGTCTLSGSTSPLSCTVPGLPASTMVTFYVTAASTGGNGPSASASETTSTITPTSSSLVIAAYPSDQYQNVGTPVTNIATLPSGTTGTTEFLLGPTLASATPLAGCAARVIDLGYSSCTTSSLVQGANVVWVVYSGDHNFAASSSSFTYTMASTTLNAPTSPLVISTTFGPGNLALTLSTTGGSGSGTVSYTATNGTATGCLVSGTTLTIVTAGTCLVTATKPSDGSFLPEMSNVTMVTFFATYAAIYAVTSITPVYYCPSGGLLSGTTCSSQSESANSAPSCPSGWTLPNPNTGRCFRTASITKAACTADGGSWNASSSTCTLYTSEGTAYTCPSGWSPPSGSPTCTYPSYGASVEYYNYTYGYTCPDQGSESGYLCTITGGGGPNVRGPLARSVALSNTEALAPLSKSQRR